jgi:alkaline phosphatase D
MINIRYLAILAPLVLAGCAVPAANQAALGPGNAPADSVQSASEALRPFYAGLTAPLPKAPPGIELDESAAITRFAFGSCVNENRAMHFWDVIAATNPQAFLLIGDNVYGDTGTTNAADLPTLTASYRKLNSRQEYTRFRSSIPMLTVWDDHDFGANDAGGTFAFKEYAERIFEEYWGASDDVRSRPGVYNSYIFGPVGQRVQFIMLDTRFFRSDLARINYRDPQPKLGWTIPSMDPKATMLGKAQWDWLAGELDKPAELRFIISSVQVLTDAHNFEGWFSFPLQRQELYRLLAKKRVGNAMFLSGDRHSGGMYRAQLPGFGRPVYEFTSTSLNYAFGNGDKGALEPDAARLGGLWADENFGQIDIDWRSKHVKLTLKNSAGGVLEERVIEPMD